MINRTTFKQLLQPAILVALMSGMSLLATSSLLVSQQGNPHDGGVGDHGDNPVVGSLPCAVSPELDQMFGGSGTSITYPSPVLGLVGGSNLSGQIVDAFGTPYGMVNSGVPDAFSIFGLLHDGVITVRRFDANKGFMQLQQWVPDEYIGGTIAMVSTIGNPSREITGNVVDLPMQLLAAAPGPAVDGVITIQGPNGEAPDLVVHITAVGSFLTITYVP